MNEVAWNLYNEERIKAEKLYLTVQELMDCYPEEIRVSKAVLTGLITHEEGILIRRFVEGLPFKGMR